MNGGVNRWGCPYWRDHGSYPATSESLKTWQWRWEFMRRFDRYRNLWNALPTNPPEDRCRDLSSNLDNEKTLFTHLLFGMMEIWNPCLNHSQLDGNPFEFQGGVPYKFPPREYWDFYLHDGKSYKELYEAILNVLETMGLLMGVDDWSSTDFIAYVPFNLSRPIEPQLKRAKVELKKDALIKRSSRLGGKRKNWPLYLRVIDAETQNAEPMEIWKHLAKEVEHDVALWDEFQDVEEPSAKINTWRKAAKELMTNISLLS